MPSSPEDPQPRSAPSPGTAEDALRRLEQRLDRASQAAERLMAEAAAEAARAGAGRGGDSRGGGADHPGRLEDDPGADEPRPAEPPPAGWQIPDDTDAPPSPGLDPLVGLVQALRDLIPPDLQRRLVAAVRELLLALRALIDWYLERLERQREQSVELEDIPIL